MSVIRDVAILDLGLGNLRSVARAFERAGARATITSSAERARASEAIVVPGQGAFGDCVQGLGEGLRDVVRDTIREDRPYFGICLGMQVLFESSEEAPGRPGLGVLAGSVRRFRADLRDEQSGERLKVPHMGWNQLGAGPAPAPIEDGAWCYFVHSYYCAPADASVVAATSDYGGAFCSAVARGRMFACQFHPEKSQAAGHAVLTRFLEGRWS